VRTKRVCKYFLHVEKTQLADGGEHTVDVGAVGFCPAEAEAEEEL